MNVPHKWEVIVYAGSYYESLAQNMGGNDINLGCEHDDHTGYIFLAYSYHIDELDDKELVAKRLYSLQLILNGALRINEKRDIAVPIKFDKFALCKNGVSHSVYADTLDEFPFSNNLEIDKHNSHFQDPGRSYISFFIFNSKKFEAVRTLLFQAGLISINTLEEKILTWGTLYKMLDTIKFYSKEINVNPYDFAEKNQIEAFTAACNNMAILGVNSRHAVPNNTPPKKVITDVSEACDLLLSMANKFLKKYIHEKT